MLRVKNQVKYKALAIDSLQNNVFASLKQIILLLNNH